MLLLTAYAAFGVPSVPLRAQRLELTNQSHMDYGAKISSLLEAELPIKVTPEQVTFESIKCNTNQQIISETIA